MKTKRALWWLAVVVTTPPYLVYVLIISIWQLLPAVMGVFELAMFRFECWSADVKRGDLYNCPWERTYKQAFIEAYQGY